MRLGWWPALIVVIIAAASLAPMRALGGGLNFLPQKVLSTGTGSNPSSVCVADFNGDGKMDMVNTNQGTASLLVWFGFGNGTFQSSPTLYNTSPNPFGVSALDVNGDGKLDLVTFGYASSVGSVLLGNGDGTFQPHLDYSYFGMAYTLSIADVNLDGKPDLGVVFTQQQSSTGEILLGNGDGTFQSPINVTLASAATYGVVLLDVNADGKPDMITTNLQALTVSVLLGNGDGTFRAHVDYTTGGNAAMGLFVADLNNDTKPDIVTGNLNIGSGMMSVLLGNGDGTFKARRDYPIYSGQFLVPGDINGDGVLDVVSPNPYQGYSSVDVFFGNGDGTFQPFTRFLAGNKPYPPCIADLNGDGLMDLISPNNYDNTLSVFIQPGVQTFTSASPCPSTSQRCLLSSTAGGSTYVTTTSAPGTITPASTSICSAVAINSTAALVTLLSPGTCTLNAIATNGGTASQAIYVGITITSTTAATRIISDTYQLACDSASPTFAVATGTTAGACSINSASSGLVTFTGIGQCVLTATSNGVTSNAQTVNVTAGLVSFTSANPCSSSSAPCKVSSTPGGSIYLVQTNVSSDISSSASSICSAVAVNSTAALVTLLSPGTCTLNAIATNGGTASQAIYVGITITSTTAATRIISDTYQLACDSASPTFAVATGTTAGACSINSASSGLVTFTGIGQCVLTATSNGVTSNAQTVNVTAGLVSFTSANPCSSSSAPCKVSSTPGGSTYLATISAPGTIMPASTSICSTTAVNSTAVRVRLLTAGNCTLNVIAINSGVTSEAVYIGVTITSTTAAMRTVGSTYQLACDSMSPSFSVAAGSTAGACSIDSPSSGLVSFIGVGQCVLTASSNGVSSPGQTVFVLPLDFSSSTGGGGAGCAGTNSTQICAGSITSPLSSLTITLLMAVVTVSMTGVTIA